MGITQLKLKNTPLLSVDIKFGGKINIYVNSAVQFSEYKL